MDDTERDTITRYVEDDPISVTAKYCLRTADLGREIGQTLAGRLPCGRLAVNSQHTICIMVVKRIRPEGRVLDWEHIVRIHYMHGKQKEEATYDLSMMDAIRPFSYVADYYRHDAMSIYKARSTALVPETTLRRNRIQGILEPRCSFTCSSEPHGVLVSTTDRNGSPWNSQIPPCMITLARRH